MNDFDPSWEAYRDLYEWGWSQFLCLVSFRCKNCDFIINVPELHSVLEEEYRDEIADALESEKMNWWEVAIDDRWQIGRITTKIPYACPKCNKELYLKLIGDFSYNHELDGNVYYLNDLYDYSVLDIESADILCEDGLCTGEEAMHTLLWFLLRWSELSYKIDIVSPFIDEMGWSKLLHRGIFTDLNNIITRKTQYVAWRHFGNPIKALEKSGKSVCDQCYKKEEEPPCFSGDFPCDWNNMHDLVKKVNLASKKFHCKFYAGFDTKNRVELLISSYNLNKSELTQPETFSIRVLDYKTYSRNFDISKLL